MTPESMLEQIVLNLPNFLGLVLALIVVTRQNIKLTDAMIAMLKDCDCQEKPPQIVITPDRSDQKDPP